MTPRNTSVDVVMFGTSHCRVFSRGRNHARIEEILAKKVLNLGRGGGGGIVPARLYLDNFIWKGNRAHVVVLMIDPFMMLSRAYNEGRHVYGDEPIESVFLLRMAIAGVDSSALTGHLRAKFTWAWIQREFLPPGHYDEKHSRALESIDPAAVRKRLASIYPDGVRPEVFERYARELRTFVHRVRQDLQADLFMLTPPTLLGELPGIDLLRELCQEIERGDAGVVYRDLSQAMPEPRYYYNHDHLNWQGVEHFATHHLRPLVGAVKQPAPAGG